MLGLEYFKTFYSELSISGLILFWSVIFFVFLLIFFAISVYLKNKELSSALLKEINKKKEEPIIKEEMISKIEEPIFKEEEVISEKEEEMPVELPSGPYQKNILRDIETRYQTSPIHIIKKGTDTVNLNELDSINNNYTQKLSPINITKTDYDEEYYNSLNDGKNNISFVEEISKKLEETTAPDTIELTDYEQKQEEEAIISYQQLLQVQDKEKIYPITDDEDIDDFIDALKEFRTDL